jgi:hypothetical protein
MSSGNKHPYPFMIVLGTLCCLGVLSLINNSFSFGNHNTRPLDILADLKKEEETPPETIPGPAVKEDSTTIAATMAPPIDYATYPGIIEYGGQNSGMRSFVNALKALRAGQRKKVRIAYFGDSMIEGDLITQDLRDSLQHFFGGEGVGFVPATSVVSGFRTSIRHSFSGNWMDYHFKNIPPKGTELGISGHVFLPAAQSWVKYQPADKGTFDEVSLLYGSGGGEVMINNKPLRLDGRNSLNAKSFISDSTQNSLTLQFKTSTLFYGACFESPAGIFLDNYSFRGISGIELGKLSKNMWMQMQSVRPYDLIVLHYGANVLFLPENTKFDWYERPMVKVVDSLRQLFPNTSFLIVGTADKAYKKKGKYVTAPGVKALMKIQHNFAESRGMAYWNLFSAMGGEGAMARWVEGDTTYANKDYTHFNFRGASKIGGLLYKAIMDEYKQEQL